MRLILLLCCLLTSQLAQTKTLEIHSFEFPPYIMQNQAGETEGIIVDLIDLAMTELDVTVEYKLSNWARAYRTVSSHKSQGLIPTMRTPDREALFYYPDTAFLLLDQHLITIHSSEVEVFSGDFAELDDWRVGKVRNAKISPAFDDALSHKLFDVDNYNSVSSLVRSLLRQRLDIIATDSRQARYVAAQNNQAASLKLLKPELGAIPVYLAFSRQQVSQAQVTAFDAALAELLARGTLKELEEKYLSLN